MRVVFLGNHTVGVKVLEAIRAEDEVVGVVAHPPDPEDGVRYLSVYEHALKQGWNVIRSTPKDPILKDFITDASPDLLWITDYRYIIPSSLASLAPFGAVNLHPSLLPKYRGQAPINWAILNGERILGLTAHFVDEGVDSGDIIEQISFELREHQDVGDALQILYPLYNQVTHRVLGYFRIGQVPRKPQDHSQATVFTRRRPEHGRIEWSQSVRSICNLVRAVAHPYPGAFTSLSGCKLIVWKALPSTVNISAQGRPGMVLDVGSEGVHVQCGDGVLLMTLTEFATDSDLPILRRGAYLGTRVEPLTL